MVARVNRYDIDKDRKKEKNEDIYHREIEINHRHQQLNHFV